jgi:hypothetical protein
MSLMLKKIILRALEADDFVAITSRAEIDRKVLSTLIRFSYDKETLVGWRAIKAAGLVARTVVKTDHEFLRDTCRKLLWSLTDESGGIGWSAPEILGEIVSADPVRFDDIIPLIAQVYEVEEDFFRSGVLYALGLIAKSAPGRIVGFQKVLIFSLADKDPLTRVRGLQLLETLWASKAARDLWSSEYCNRIRGMTASMISDKSEAWVYDNSEFKSIMVGELAENMMKKLF